MWNSHAIFFRCFVAKKGTETELKRKLHVVFPRWPLPTIYRMRTHDYILAMGVEENQFTEDESSDFDSPERPRQMLISKFMFKKAHNVSTKLAESIHKFHADQQGTMFPCKHKSMEANHFKLVSRLMTSVEEDRQFYFSPGINGSNSDKTLKFVTSASAHEIFSEAKPFHQIQEIPQNFSSRIQLPACRRRRNCMHKREYQLCSHIGRLCSSHVSFICPVLILRHIKNSMDALMSALCRRETVIARR
ncbi:hypothetical protein YC2023_036412 [Brassica napus]